MMPRPLQRQPRPHERIWNGRIVDKNLNGIWLERLNALKAFNLISICGGHEQRRTPHINLRLKWQYLDYTSSHYLNLDTPIRNIINDLFPSEECIVKTEFKIINSNVPRHCDIRKEDFIITVNYPQRSSVGSWLDNAINNIEILDQKLLSYLQDSVPEYTDRYSIIWFPRGRIKAEVRNYTINCNGYRKIEIIKNDVLMKKMRERFLASEDGEPPIINVSRAFMKLPLNMREAAIWHEVGHIHYEHHSRLSVLSQEKLRTKRIEYINAGDVMLEEKEADAFSVKQIGKEAMAEFLKYLLATRPRGDVNSLKEIGRKELENRLKIIMEG